MECGQATMNAACQAIEDLRRQWGARLLILGHYYQRDEVLRHADFVGDSLDLSRRAAAERQAERIVFCGVHFMAESADILRRAGQAVYMPDPGAGCPMADMAPLREVQRVWDHLAGLSPGWVPIVYVNSSAAVKAFCGERGGSTCTSSNAAAVFRRALDGGRRILFIPDEHLGTNTALDLGLPEEAVSVCDPGRISGALTAGRLERVRILAWMGYCHVHAFSRADLDEARRRHPGARVLVHPETPAAVARQADGRGSTAQIIRAVEAAPAGSTLVVGTEWRLVDRLARQQAGRVTVVPLRQSVCPNMGRTTESKLLDVLRGWPESRTVRVPDPLRDSARLALSRMLDAT